MKPIKLEAFRRAVPIDIEIRIAGGFVVEKTYTLRSLTMGQLSDGLLELKGEDGLKQFIAECSDIPTSVLNTLDMTQIKILVGMIQGVMPTDDQAEVEQSEKN